MSDRFERYGAGAGPELAGKLVKFTSIGCYPVYYLDSEGNTVCADCANDDDHDGNAPSAAGVNWEDPDLYCDECSKRIESAYAEDLVPKCSTCGTDRHPGIRCE